MNRALHRFAIVLAAISAVAAGFFALKVVERERLTGHLIREAVPDRSGLDTSGVVLSLSERIYGSTNRSLKAADLPWYERWEATSFFNVSSGVSLKYGIFGVEGQTQYGPCGTMSRTLLTALWALHVPARKLVLLDPTGQSGGHTMVEFWDDGKWRVISPADSSFTWRTRDGGIASVDDILQDSTVFAQVFTRRPGYPFRFSDAWHIRWEKLPEPLRSIVHRVLGDRRYRNFTTPHLYDMPRHLFLLVALAIFAVTAVVAWTTRRPRARAS